MSSMTGARNPMTATGMNKVPKGYEAGQLQQFSPEQMQLFQQLFSHIGSGSQLSKLAMGDQSQFEAMEAPALRRFSELQGNIASRFSGMGTGARKSSGFQNVMGGAGADLAERLASNRMSLQRQALEDLMGMSSSLLQQRPFENFLAPKQKPFWQELLMGLSQGVGEGVGSLPMFFAGGGK